MLRVASLKLTQLFLYLIPLALLIVPRPMFFPYISGKMLLIRSFIEIAFFFYLLLCFVEPRARPAKNLLTIAVGLFFVSLVLSTIFSTSRTISFFGNAERMEAFFSLSHWILFFFIFYGLLRLDNTFVLKFLLVLFGVGIFIGIFGIFQHFDFQELLPFVLKSEGGRGRVSSFFGNPVYLGSFGLFSILVALFAYFYFRRFKLFFLLTAIFGFIDILISQTRSALIGLATGVLAFLIFAALKDKSRFRFVALGFILLGIALFIAFWFVHTEPWFIKIPAIGRFATVLIGSDTSVTRLLVWRAFLTSFQEKPILGWGLEQMIPAFTKYINPRLFALENAWFDRAHNKFIDLLTMQGIMGFISFILMLCAAGINIHRAHKLTSASGVKREGNTQISTSVYLPYAMLIGFLFAYIGNHFFIFDFNASYIIFYTFLAITSMVRFSATPQFPQDNKRQTKINPPTSLSVGKYFILLCAFIFVLYSLYFNYISYQSNKLIVAAAQFRDPTQGLKTYEKSFTMSRAFQEEIVGQLLNYTRQIPDERARKQGAELSQKFLEVIIANNPLSLKNRIFEIENLGTLFTTQRALGASQETLAQIETTIHSRVNEAIELAPLMPNSYFAYANVFEKLGDYKNALTAIKKALVISPHSGLANLLAAYLSGKLGDSAAAQEYGEKTIEVGFGYQGDLRSPQSFALARQYLQQIYIASGRQSQLQELDRRLLTQTEAGLLAGLGRGGTVFTPEQYVALKSYLTDLYKAAGMSDQLPQLDSRLKDLEERYKLGDFEKAK